MEVHINWKFLKIKINALQSVGYLIWQKIMELWYLASWIGQLVVELGWSILQTYCMMVWKYTMLLYLYIIWDKFSLVVTTCSNGANPAQNVNGFTKTCTVASDCGEPATCENQICCPAPIQEGKILDKWRWFNGI